MINHFQDALIERAPAPEEFGVPKEFACAAQSGQAGAIALLVKAGVLSSQDLSEAEDIALDSAVPLEHVLIRAHFLNERLVNAAQAAQVLIDYKRLHEWIAVGALQEVCAHAISLNDALEKLGWQV